jgi:2-hydroxychromene-2-carboxylate isomerase
MSEPSSVIEVFGDVGCPFAHVGLRLLAAHRASIGRDDVRLWVRAWPLEIVNGKPLDADFIAEEVDDIRRQVDPHGFVGFDRSTFPATFLPAMALAAIAYDRALEVGESVSLELRRLLFEQGVDVSSPAVLAAVAESHDLHITPGELDDPTRVMADRAEGIVRGVVGSPYFFTATGGFFCPSLDIHRDPEGHLHIEFDPHDTEEFVSSAFAGE